MYEIEILIIQWAIICGLFVRIIVGISNLFKKLNKRQGGNYNYPEW